MRVNETNGKKGSRKKCKTSVECTLGAAKSKEKREPRLPLKRHAMIRACGSTTWILVCCEVFGV